MITNFKLMLRSRIHQGESFFNITIPYFVSYALHQGGEPVFFFCHGGQPSLCFLFGPLLGGNI